MYVCTYVLHYMYIHMLIKGFPIQWNISIRTSLKDTSINGTLSSVPNPTILLCA